MFCEHFLELPVSVALACVYVRFKLLGRLLVLMRIQSSILLTGAICVLPATKDKGCWVVDRT